MKKLILAFTTLVLLSSSALAFQGTSEPPDLPQSQFSNMATINSADKIDDQNSNMGDDHEAHTEEENKHRVRRKMLFHRLPK